MNIQAQWNDEVFGRTANSLRNLESFEISCSIKTEEKESSNGVKKTVVKGLNAEELKISYNAGFAVGTDPRQEFDDFKKIADKGKSADFYLGTSKVGIDKFMLDSVDLADVVHGNNGRFFSGKISLNFSVNKGASSSKNKSSSSSSNSGGMKLTPQDYENARKLVQS
jgi:hypothetical protein